MLINRYQDISEIDKEARKDYIDRHSAFIHCEEAASKEENFKVTVKVGEEYVHPDDFDHYISWVQLWNGETMLAQASYMPGTLGNIGNQFEVDFHIRPAKKMRLVAHAYCTKHGLWESDVKVVDVT
jgi:superoxide reductase